MLCEKPICNEIAKAAEMVARAREQSRCFGVDFNHRFTPAARLAKKWVNEGRLGHLLFVNMSMWIKNPERELALLPDQGPAPAHRRRHALLLRRHRGGPVLRHQGARAGRSGPPPHFNMHFRNGVVGHLTGSYDIERGHPMERCEVAGTGGRFVLEDMWREATLYPAGNLEKTVYTNPVFGGMRDFEDTFRNRIHTLPASRSPTGVAPDEIDGSGADGLAAQKVLAAAIESLETGRVVRVD